MSWSPSVALSGGPPGQACEKGGLFDGCKGDDEPLAAVQLHIRIRRAFRVRFFACHLVLLCAGRPPGSGALLTYVLPAFKTTPGNTSSPDFFMKNGSSYRLMPPVSNSLGILGDRGTVRQTEQRRERLPTPLQMPPTAAYRMLNALVGDEYLARTPSANALCRAGWSRTRPGNADTPAQNAREKFVRWTSKAVDSRTQTQEGRPVLDRPAFLFLRD